MKYYDLLLKCLIEELSKDKELKKFDINCSFVETVDDVLDPRELSDDNKNLMVFDDSPLERQIKCETYYIRGRYSKVDCFYLAQNYFQSLIKTLRENTNLICLDLKNINHIYI